MTIQWDEIEGEIAGNGITNIVIANRLITPPPKGVYQDTKRIILKDKAKVTYVEVVPEGCDASLRIYINIDGTAAVSDNPEDTVEKGDHIIIPSSSVSYIVDPCFHQ